MKKEIMKLAGKQMELENIILIKVTQAENDKYHIFARMQALASNCWICI